jgi:2-polyprenyl-6-methoxyphenol hydroxylase-like FAD-dependent oxidoreductase
MYQAKDRKPEVVIIGAGPTGLMMACQLALFNIRFRIIDLKKSPSSYSGAMVIHARTMEVFQQMGLAETFLKQGTVINGLSVYFNGKKSSHLNLAGTGKKLSQFPFIFLVEQRKTERILIEFLQQKGTRVEWLTELATVEQYETNVKAEFILPDGNRETVMADYLIAADGGKSGVRAALKIPFEGKTHKASLSVMECEADIISPFDELLFSFSRQATTGFFPLSKGNWRIDASIRNLWVKNWLTFGALQKKFNRKTRLNANIRNPEWFSTFYSHGKYALFFRLNRCFLVGDAAHLFTPVGGQGMNTGLQDAQNLAWKLALFIKGKVKPELLYTYQTERKPIAIATCRASDRFFKLMASGSLKYGIFRMYLLPTLLKLFFRLMGINKFSDAIFRRISGVGISYQENVLNMSSDENILKTAPLPGERLPFISYVDDNKMLAYIQEKINCTKFQLLIFSSNSDYIKELQKVIKNHDEVIENLIIPFNPSTADIYIQFGVKNQGWYLIRPDMYIACRSVEPGAGKLKEYLQKVFNEL